MPQAADPHLPTLSMDLHESETGRINSQETHSPRQPNCSPPLPAPAPFQFPLLAPLQSAPDTAERTLEAKEGWKKKRADLKRECTPRTITFKDESKGEMYELNGECGAKRAVGAECQYDDENWSVDDDGADEAEGQLVEEKWSARDDGADDAEAQYPDEKWRAWDDGADEALQASRMKSNS